MKEPVIKITSVVILNKIVRDSAISHLDIEFTEIGEDHLITTMPVVSKPLTPYGLLYGGVSVVLAETLGSMAANCTFNDPIKQSFVGLEINANHLKAVRSGVVEGRATPIHIGQSTQVWQIKIYNSGKQLLCVSRITMLKITNDWVCMKLRFQLL